MKTKITSLPYLLWMAIFIVVPLAMVMYFGFTTEDGGITLEHFVKIGTNWTYLKTFLKSIYLAVIATAICLVLAYPLSFMISRMNVNSQKTMIMIVMIPMWMNFLLRTYAWMTLIEPNGLINKFLGIFGIGPFDMLYTQGAVVLGMVYNYIPFMILPLYSVMEKIDGRVIEAAQDLGANAFKVFVKVLLPLSVPGIVTGITMVFVPAVSTFVISRYLGGEQNFLIGDMIEQQFISGTYNPYLGSAMSIVLMVIMLICMGFVNRLDEEDKEGMAI